MLCRSTEEVLKGTFYECSQSKLTRSTFYPFLVEFQVLFQVVCDRREVHHLVGLFQTNGIYLSHAPELGQCSSGRYTRNNPWYGYRENIDPILLLNACGNCSSVIGRSTVNWRTAFPGILFFPAYLKLRSISRSAMITTLLLY